MASTVRQSTPTVFLPPSPSRRAQKAAGHLGMEVILKAKRGRADGRLLNVRHGEAWPGKGDAPGILASNACPMVSPRERLHAASFGEKAHKKTKYVSSETNAVVLTM